MQYISKNALYSEIIVYYLLLGYIIIVLFYYSIKQLRFVLSEIGVNGFSDIF